MVKDWKRDLANILVRLGLVPSDFTGQVEVNMNEGGITIVKRLQTLK